MVRDAKQIPIGPLLGDRILVLHGSLTKEDVLNTLIDRLAQVEGMVPHDDLAWGIFHRESLMSTGIGNGIAVPHVRLENIDSPSMALAVCPDGISDYQSPDNQPVKLIFMVVAGGQQRATHLKILASIGSLSGNSRPRGSVSLPLPPFLFLCRSGRVAYHESRRQHFALEGDFAVRLKIAVDGFRRAPSGFTVQM